jgi:hypothetical protein
LAETILQIRKLSGGIKLLQVQRNYEIFDSNSK